MQLLLSLLTVSKVLGRGLTIEPDSLTTYGYTAQVATWFRGVIKTGKFGTFGLTTLIPPLPVIWDSTIRLTEIGSFCAFQELFSDIWVMTPLILIMDAYSRLAAISDFVSEFCCGQPPRRQHQLPLQLPDPLACPVLLSLVNHTSHMIQLRMQNFYMFLHKRFCIIWDRCGHCQRFAPFWQALAEDIKGRQTDCHLLWVKAFDKHLEKLSNFQSRLATPCQSGCYQLCGAILW